MEDAPLRILLIEDEAEHAALIRRAFAGDHAPVELRVARSLREAEQDLAQSVPDLLIADLCLGDGKGTDLLGNMIPGLPAVIMTSHGEEFTAVEAAEFGAIDFVVKSPGVFSDMPRIARRAIRRWGEAPRRWWPQIHYQQFVEREKDIIFTLDRAGYITFSNPAAKSVLGYSSEELLGKHFEGLLSPEYQKRTKTDFRKLFKKKHEEFAAETVLLDKDGAAHFVEYSATILEQDGKTIGVSGIARDVTPRKRVEAELSRYRDHLEELVAARTAELARTNEQLKWEIEERKRGEKALRFRGEFENLVASLSTHFINLSLDEVDKGINYALQTVGEFVGADHSFLFQLDDAGETFLNTHQWRVAEIEASPAGPSKISVKSHPWWKRRLETLELIHVPIVEKLPPEAAAEKELLEPASIKSIVAVPITVGEKLIGFVGLSAVRETRIWSTDDMVLLKIVGELFAGVLERHRAESDLRESHERFLAVLSSLDAAVYVADMETHELLFVNKFTDGVMGDSKERLCWKVLQRSQTGPCPFCTNSRLIDAQGKPTGVYIWEFQNTKNGCWYECHDQAVPWIDGRLVRLEIAIDITQRKLAEKTLQKEQQLLREMVDLQEQERRLVAYEIHDGLAQQVAGALLQFQAYEQLNDPENKHARRAFERGLHLLSESVQEARRLISGLRPPILDESGIVAAVEYLICEHDQHGSWNIEFTHDIAAERLASPLETAVFRIVQEALANACKHSGSETIRVDVVARRAHVTITVEDWGVGFEPDRVASGRFGLQGIRERARLLGGKAVIESTTGRGTRVAVNLPLVERADQMN